MLRKLYDWTLSLAARKTAEAWLAVIAFIESSVFLVPADVLFLPMALARPDRAYRYALIATIASTLGGIAGYLLGYFAYEAVAKPVLAFYGKLDEFRGPAQLRRRRHADDAAGHLGPVASAADQGGHHPGRRGPDQPRLLRRLLRDRARRPVLRAGLGTAPLRRADPPLHRAPTRADRRAGGGCLDRAVFHRSSIWPEPDPLTAC